MNKMEQSYNHCKVESGYIILHQSTNSDYRIKNIFYPWHNVIELYRIMNYLPCWIEQMNYFFWNYRIKHFDKLPPNLQILYMTNLPIFSMDNLPLLLNELYIYNCNGTNMRYKYYNIPNKLMKITINCLCYKKHNIAIQFTETILKRIELIQIRLPTQIIM